MSMTLKNNEKHALWAQRSFQNHDQTFHDRWPEKIRPLPKKSDHWFTRTCPENILAPKLTSRACALRVCLPPAAIAVTQAISQTLICKASRIDSPSLAQMNKQRHKTWSFCLKYYILSKSNKTQRQVGGIFHLWQFLLDQIAHGRWPGIKKWRHVNKWKPWSFQLHCAVKPYFSVTKWKMHLLNAW